MDSKDTPAKAGRKQPKPRISEATWNSHEEELHRLYVIEGMTVKEVQANMAKYPEFERATERQYTYHFKEKKGWRHYKCPGNDKGSSSESSHTMHIEKMNRAMIENRETSHEWLACFHNTPQRNANAHDTAKKLEDDVEQLTQGMTRVSVHSDDNENKAFQCLVFVLRRVATDLTTNTTDEDDGYLLPVPFIKLLVWLDEEVGDDDDMRIYPENMCVFTYVLTRWVTPASNTSPSPGFPGKEWAELCRSLHTSPVRVILAMVCMITTLYRYFESSRRKCAQSPCHPASYHDQYQQKQHRAIKRPRLKKQISAAAASAAASAEAEQKAKNKFRRLLKGVEAIASRILEVDEWLRPETLLEQFARQYSWTYCDDKDDGRRDPRMRDVQERARQAANTYLDSLGLDLDVDVDEDGQDRHIQHGDGGDSDGDGDGDVFDIRFDSIPVAEPSSSSSWTDRWYEELRERNASRPMGSTQYNDGLI